MVQAHRLAEWVGADPRPVTAGEVLRRPDVSAAGAALGVAVPQRLRTAADVPALHRPWCVAVGTGLLKIDAGMVTAGPALASWPTIDHDALLNGWLAGLRTVCVSESDRRYPDSVAILVFSALGILALDALSVGNDLKHLVRSVLRGNPELYDRFHYTTFGRYTDTDTGRMSGLLDLLGMFGAVTGAPGDVRVTTLGRWAVARIREEEPEDIGTGLSADEVVTRLAKIGDDRDAWAAVQPWLSARTPMTAATELLAAAVDVPAERRLAVIDVVDGIGEPALPAWRKATQLPNVGPHARAILAAWDDSDPQPADQRWLAIEFAAAALSAAGPDDALSQVYADIPGADLGSRLAAVRASGHPEAQSLAEALTSFLASGAPRTIDQVLQLKVTLLRWRPPIWRRVLMPATASLADLHRVIQVLFGWDGDHLHAFTVGQKRYSDPFYNLDALEMSDEYEMRLRDAFTAGTNKIIYAYDFGAGWRHEIALERTVERKPTQIYPVCKAFKSNSPVEYWSEDDPTDPEPFDLVDVNRRLQVSKEDGK